MKLEELLQFDVRENGLIVKAVRKATKSGILLADETEMTTETTNFYALKVSDTIKDIEPGDELFVTGAAFIPLIVKDRKETEAYFYCPAAFCKLVKRNNKASTV